MEFDLKEAAVLLTYDVGNTNIVVGLFEGDQLVAYWRFASDRNRTGDELRLTTRSLLDEAGVGLDAIEGIAVASVVPSLNAPLRTGLAPLISGPVRFLSADTSPIPLLVDRPGNVGGAIAPEMELAARALTETAAQLYAVELQIPRSVVGKDTASNLQAGIVLGYLDLVDGLIARFRTEVAEDLPVIATGGRGRLFYEELDAIEHFDPFLTQKGLQIWWTSSAP